MTNKSVMTFLYVNKYLSMIPVPDDTNTFLNGKNINELVQCMDCELNKFVIWLAANKLFLNI